MIEEIRMIDNRKGLIDKLMSTKKMTPKEHLTLFKNDDIFAHMLNNGWKKLTIDPLLETIEIKEKTGRELAVLTILSSEDYKRAFRMIQDKAFMDISIKKGKQETLGLYPKFGNLISKDEFRIIQKSHVISIEIFYESDSKLADF